MLVNAVECKECNTIVYSRTEDDVRECNCGRVVVSGGQGHFKYDVFTNPQYEIRKIRVDASLRDLYEDWYNMNDDFGLIEEDTSPEEHQNVHTF